MIDDTDLGKSNKSGDNSSYSKPASRRIIESDVVSGRLYLKLIRDFKEHEKKLKDELNALRSKLGDRNTLIDSICTQDPSKKGIVKLMEKIRRLREKVMQKNQEIEKLKLEKAQLLMKIVELNKSINTVK